MSAAWDMATGSTRVVLGLRPQRVAGGRVDEEEMADVDEEGEEVMGEARDLMMAMNKTETATRTETDTETKIQMGALATDD
jgi:hypothetical protein